MQLLRLLRADLQKLRRTPLLWMHLALPLLGAALCYFYCRTSPLDPLQKVSLYLQLLAIAFPLLCGLVCSLAAEQEAQAGRFYPLLTASTPKFLAFFSKLLLLSLLGLGASLLAVGGFGLLFRTLPGGAVLPPGFYMQAGALLFGSNLLLYLLHLVLGLRLGGGASIGLGIVESLVSALLLTGLGDGVWPLVHCAWGIRLTGIALHRAAGSPVFQALLPEWRLALPLICCVTAAALVLALCWFTRWQGGRPAE